MNDVWVWRRAPAASNGLRLQTPGSGAAQISVQPGGRWELLTPAAQWSSRARFVAGFLPVVPTNSSRSRGPPKLSGRLYVLGGMRSPHSPPAAEVNSSIEAGEDVILSDVWMSEDGTNWTRATSYAPWGAGAGQEAGDAGQGDGGTTEGVSGAGARIGFSAVTHGTVSGQRPYILVMGGLRKMQIAGSDSPEQAAALDCPRRRRRVTRNAIAGREGGKEGRSDTGRVSMDGGEVDERETARRVRPEMQRTQEVVLTRTLSRRAGEVYVERNRGSKDGGRGQENVASRLRADSASLRWDGRCATPGDRMMD